MLFLKISNTNILFNKENLRWKSYTINKTLLTTKQVQIIKKKDFVIVELDINRKTFVLYVGIQEWEEMSVYLKR